MDSDQTKIASLRGGRVRQPKQQGRRVQQHSQNHTNLVNDPVAGGDVSDVCRLLELHLVLECRKPYCLVCLGLGHDDHAAVLVEDAKRLLVGHSRRYLLGQQSLVPRIHGEARLFPAVTDAGSSIGCSSVGNIR